MPPVLRNPDLATIDKISDLAEQIQVLGKSLDKVEHRWAVCDAASYIIAMCYDVHEPGDDENIQDIAKLKSAIQDHMILPKGYWTS